MQQTAVPVPAQVSGVAQVPRATEPEEESSLAVAKLSEAQAMRAEIIRVGRKLWERQYVDGNGGNISARLGSRYALGTPTMLSKGDLEPSRASASWTWEGNLLAGELAHQRTAAASGDLQGEPQGPRRGALSSALRHGFFHHRHHAAQRADFRVRDLHRPGSRGFL